MHGEMTVEEIEAALKELMPNYLSKGDMELVIEFIDNTETCPACGQHLKIVEK